MSSAGPCQYGTSKIAHVAPDDRRELAGARRRSSAASGRCTGGPGGARTCRRPRSCPGASIRPIVGMPVRRCVQASQERPRPRRFGLPGRSGIAPRSVTSSGSKGRPGPGCRSRRRATWTRRPEPREQLDEGVVLALGDVEVDRVEEAVGRVVEGPPERRAGPLDEDLAERRGHALGAVGQGGRVHAAQDTGPRGLVDRRSVAYPAAMPGYVAIAFVEPSTRRIARPVRDEPRPPTDRRDRIDAARGRPRGPIGVVGPGPRAGRSPAPGLGADDVLPVRSGELALTRRLARVR